MRTNDHLGISILTNNNYTYNENTTTAIRKHNHDPNHISCIDDVHIIRTANNNYHLQLKESIIISILKPTFNVAKDSIPLRLFDN